MGKRFLSFALVIALALGLALSVSADTPRIRVVSIFDTTGDDVTLTRMVRGTARHMTPSLGERLRAEDTITTGNLSHAYLRLEGREILRTHTSTARMDEQSTLRVSERSNTNLALTLESGGLSIEANQRSGDVLRVRGGDTVLSVRGTLFAVEYDGGAPMTVYMLSGSGDAGGAVIEAGEIMRGGDVEPFAIDERLTLFALETMLEHVDKLIAEGLFSADDVAEIERLYAERRAERMAQERPANPEPKPEPEPEPEIEPEPEPEPEPIVILGGDNAGPNASWLLDNGVLHIYGTGRMYNWELLENGGTTAPWWPLSLTHAISSVIIGEHVTTAGAFAFAGMDVRMITFEGCCTVPMERFLPGYSCANCFFVCGFMCEDKIAVLPGTYIWDSNRQLWWPY